MIQQLAGARILVADDQSDVARTLCRPLHKAGARLRFVADGHTALQEIATRPFDLILIDMKMPPEEWGGLWLLGQLKDGGWRLPSLVLSGEGSKQQVIEALRLDATDWVLKDHAGEELLERCAKVLSDRHDQALTLAGNDLPSPLAHRFARYERTADPGKKAIEGLHTLEAIFRFAALLGLSTTPPAPLRGITAARLAAPSMGTWFDICTALAKLPGAGSDFMRMLAWLVPEGGDHRPVQELITVRNDFAHGRSAPSVSDAEQLDALLCRFAHRAASSWRADIAVPVSMTFDGTTYAVDALSLKGTDKPIPGTLPTRTSMITGQAFVVPHGAEPIPLAPWLLTHTPPGTHDVRCLQFDGLQRGNPANSGRTPFRYAKTDEGVDTPAVNHPDATEQTLSQWTAM
ncbi:response regulator transcription factor [Streptomyces regalis]|uniref:Response regulatory domain-containing protein n=1 Tax=Streptomyces regalis TaxID=68262 RepID=A0A101J9G5_9ACTN|nr:response regulator [Streptomyces regalis]KUL22683.1 hypothetical protein ADL12_41540 [Streptomyces regalis]